MRYVTAQVPGGKLTMPEEYLHLDGWQKHFITEKSLLFGHFKLIHLRKCNMKTRGIAVNGRPGPAGQGQVQDCSHKRLWGEGKKSMVFTACIFICLWFWPSLVLKLLSLNQVKQSRALIESIVKENKVRLDNEKHLLPKPTSTLHSLDSEFILTFYI